MDTKDKHIIRIVGRQSRGTERRVAHADVVIDAEGMVTMDRYGQADRPATAEELRLAVEG